MSLRVESLSGPALVSALDDLARLRIAVFREWPYLYDGDLAYEARYLVTYAAAPGAVLVAARDGDRLVGASTGMPLLSHGDAAALALPEGAPPRAEIYYCAESVLLPAYRGRGVGHRFFDLREEVARAHGFGWTAFAAVRRAADHPARPPDHRPLDPFWRARGYAPLPEARLSLGWRDVGQDRETRKELQVWLRRL